MGRELQAHQLDDRKAVGGLPRGDGRLEQPELRRAASARPAVHFLDPGIDSVGVGAQRGGRLIVLRGDGAGGEGVDIQPTQQLVGAGGARAEDFRQAALRGAAQQGHLPKPVLRVGKAQTEEDVFVRFTKDMRDGIGVTHDLDRGGDAVDGNGLIEVRQ